MAQPQLTDSITKAVTAALDSSMSTAMKKRSKRTTTQEPVVSTPVAVRSAVDGRTPVAVRSAVDGRTPVDVRSAVDGRTPVAVRSAVDSRTPVAARSAIDGWTPVAVRSVVDSRTPVAARSAIDGWTPVAVRSVVAGPTPVDVIEMQPFIERTIQAAVATAIEAMEKSVPGENERLTKTSCDLRSVIQSQAFDVDRLAQYSRCENVRLHGVPETGDENTDDVVIGIAHDMGVDISRNDIGVSHRLPKSHTMSERPIIVKFVRRNTKTALMTNKKTLRTIDRYRHTYVNDDLTPLRSRMLRTLKNDDEVKRVWTIDGIFHCIVVENNAEVKKRLETPDDLFKLGWSQEKMQDSGLFTLH